MKIFLVGMMGSGKTSAGKKLAKLLSYQFIDADLYIEDKEKKSVSAIFQNYGETAFREIEQKYLMEIMSLNNIVISTGGGLPCYFDNMILINENGISVYLEAEPAFLRSRLISQKNERPLIANIADENLEDLLADLLEGRQEYYNKAHIHISAKSLNLKKLIEKIKFE